MSAAADVTSAIQEASLEHGRTIDEVALDFAKLNPGWADEIMAALKGSLVPYAVHAMFDDEVRQIRITYLEAICSSKTNGTDLCARASRELINLHWIGRYKDDPGHIYFVRAPELKRVKIGFSRDVKPRFKALRNGSPCRLVLLGSHHGKEAVEHAIHEYLGDHHAYGEYFHETVRVRKTVHVALSLKDARHFEWRRP